LQEWNLNPYLAREGKEHGSKLDFKRVVEELIGKDAPA
jgi:hypothetical protein